MRLSTALGLAASLALTSAAASSAEPARFQRISPEQVNWQEMADAPGVQDAVLAGDPSKPGLYVIRVRFPPHVMDRPHFHAHDRYVTVIKGTWYTGTGNAFDPAKAVPIKAGGYMFHPGGAAHWDGSNSDEDVIVQIVGLGPEDTTEVDPSQPFWVKLAH
jgi:quercetin dioxygenase-like cupin family protein